MVIETGGCVASASGTASCIGISRSSAADVGAVPSSAYRPERRLFLGTSFQLGVLLLALFLLPGMLCAVLVSRGVGENGWNGGERK